MRTLPVFRMVRYNPPCMHSASIRDCWAEQAGIEAALAWLALERKTKARTRVQRITHQNDADTHSAQARAARYLLEVSRRATERGAP